MELQELKTKMLGRIQRADDGSNISLSDFELFLNKEANELTFICNVKGLVFCFNSSDFSDITYMVCDNSILQIPNNCKAFCGDFCTIVAGEGSEVYLTSKSSAGGCKGLKKIITDEVKPLKVAKKRVKKDTVSEVVEVVAEKKKRGRKKKEDSFYFLDDKTENKEELLDKDNKECGTQNGFACETLNKTEIEVATHKDNIKSVSDVSSFGFYLNYSFFDYKEKDTKKVVAKPLFLNGFNDISMLDIYEIKNKGHT